jgi:hypothetical protein
MAEAAAFKEFWELYLPKQAFNKQLYKWLLDEIYEIEFLKNLACEHVLQLLTEQHATRCTDIAPYFRASSSTKFGNETALPLINQKLKPLALGIFSHLLALKDRSFDLTREIGAIGDEHFESFTGTVPNYHHFHTKQLYVLGIYNTKQRLNTTILDYLSSEKLLINELFINKIKDGDRRISSDDFARLRIELERHNENLVMFIQNNWDFISQQKWLDVHTSVALYHQLLINH